MAKQIIQRLIDDIDGADASETVSFGFEGVEYAIDLSQDNAGKLREALARYVGAGSRVGRSSGTWRSGAASGTRRTSGVDNKAVRAWAAENGHDLADRGRIPRSVIEAYETAQRAPAVPEKKPGKANASKSVKRTRKKAVPAAEFQPA